MLWCRKGERALRADMEVGCAGKVGGVSEVDDVSLEVCKAPSDMVRRLR